MKKITLLIVGCVLLSGVVLAEPRKVRLNISAVPTNATANVATAATTNGTSTIGYVNGLYLNFGGYASPTCDVDVVAIGGIGTVERPIFSADSVAADVEKNVRNKLTDTDGTAISDSHDKIPIFAGDRLVLRAYDANVTNAITLEGFVYIDDIP